MPRIDVPKFNVIVCGRIRNVDEFVQEVSRCLAWKHEAQIVDRIVISGWKEQYEEHGSLIRDFIRMGCEYVATPEPRFKSHGNIINQIKSIAYGLSLFNDNDLVLKTRTDRVESNFDPRAFMQHYLDNSIPGPRSPFERRIVAQIALPFQPYFISDQLLFGQSKDISKLLSFEIWYDAEHAFLNPEQIFHANPHIRTKPLLKSFFRANPGLQYANPDLSFQVYRFVLHNPFFVGAICESIKDIIDSYILGFHPPDLTNKIKLANNDVKLVDLLNIDANKIYHGVQYTHVAANIMTGNMDALEQLLKLPISESVEKTIVDFAKEGAWAKLQPSGVFGHLHPDALDLIDQITERFPHKTHTVPYADLSSKAVIHSHIKPLIFS